MKNEIVTAAKSRRKLLLRELKTIDSVISKLGGTLKRRKYTRRAVKAAVKTVAKAASAQASERKSTRKTAKRQPAAPKVATPVYET